MINFVGFMYKLTEGHEVAFYMAGGSIILAGVVLVPVLTSANADSNISSQEMILSEGRLADIVIASIPNFNTHMQTYRTSNTVNYHSAHDVRNVSVKNQMVSKHASYHAIPGA